MISSYSILKVIFLIILVSPDDYTAVSTTLAFDACDTRQCFVVETEEDCLVEQSEVFLVQMRRTGGLDSRIILSQDPASVTITDNDC